jgi:hypothetical protein
MDPAASKAKYGGLVINCPGLIGAWNVTSDSRSCAHGSAILSGSVADSVKCQVVAGFCSATAPTGPFDIATIDATTGRWSCSLSNVSHNTGGTAVNCLWVFASVGGGPQTITNGSFNGRTATSRHCDGLTASTLCP